MRVFAEFLRALLLRLPALAAGVCLAIALTSRRPWLAGVCSVAGLVLVWVAGFLAWRGESRKRAR